MQIEFSGTRFGYKKRDVPVLDRFDLVIPDGRTILLGPNGAGKSTLLGLAASVLFPDRGRVSVCGIDSGDRSRRGDYRRRVGWMAQSTRPASGLTVREQVALSGWLAGLTRQAAWTQAAESLDQVDLGELADRKTTQLSGGQRARMGLAQALVHHAEVLLLDEPTAALDPDHKDAFSALLHRLSTERTVVVSTHDVSDLEGSYDHVVLIDGGRVMFAGPTTRFLEPSGEKLSPVEAYRRAMHAR